MAGVVSIAALARLLSRRHRHEPAAPEPDPADELKSKLAAAREPEQPEPVPAEPPQEADTSLEARRAQVHEKAQQAIDEMRGPEA
jgi:hypothetical protein